MVDSTFSRSITTFVSLFGSFSVARRWETKLPLLPLSREWTTSDIERPLIDLDDAAVGFYALNGESLVSFSEDQTKESICSVLEEIRAQNPGKRILLVLDQFGSHICKYTRKRAHRLGIDLVFLPVGSAHLNPIEQVWKSLRRTASPIVVESEDEFRTLIGDIYQELTQKSASLGNGLRTSLTCKSYLEY